MSKQRVIVEAVLSGKSQREVARLYGISQPVASGRVVYEPQLRTRLAQLQPEAATSERVRAVLLEPLPAGINSMSSVAHELAMSTRTLQRHLRAEGRSFQSVLHETRESLARHYSAIAT